MTSLESRLTALRAAATDGRVENIQYRKDQLRKLHTSLASVAEQLVDALVNDTDYATQRQDAEQEVALALTCLKSHYNSLNFDQSIVDEYSVSQGHDFEHNRIPFGIIHIKVGQFTPLFSTVAPFCAALAAGNCVVIELQDRSTSLFGLISSALSPLDQDICVVISASDGINDTTISSLSSLKIWDTTSPSTHGVLLALPSAQRTVAVVDRTADIAAAAADIVHARFSHSGESPYAPDLVLVNEFVIKEFLDASVHSSISYTSDDNRSLRAAQQEQRRQPARNPKLTALTDKIVASEKSHVVISGQRGAIVHVTREYFSEPKKIDSPVLLVAAVSSLDDAIDFSNALNRQENYLASYVFGNSATMKYLSQFIRANAGFLNHIPNTLLVGPAGPSSHPLNSLLRFTPSMFSIPKPQYAYSSKTKNLKSGPHHTTKNGQVTELLKAACSPLTAANLPLGGGIDFFERGIITGLLVVAIPAVVSLVTAGTYAIRYFYAK